MNKQRIILIKNNLHLTIAFFIAIILLTEVIVLIASTKEEEGNIKGNLYSFIEKGESIMGFWPHPDDENYIPGLFAVAKDHGCNVWVSCVVDPENSYPLVEPGNERTLQNRMKAIQWLKDTFLAEGDDSYTYWYARPKQGTGKPLPPDDEIKQKYKDRILEKRPDILVTFTPFGYVESGQDGEGQHGTISAIVSEIWEELPLDYKPKIYWFVNMDQGPRQVPPYYEEYKLFPPTFNLNLDVKCTNLEWETYWDAKVEFWEQYEPSINPQSWILDNLDINDKKEYFVRVK
jgi:hypothetical protein